MDKLRKPHVTIESAFLSICAVILGITGLGKAWLVVSEMPLMHYGEPVFGFPLRFVLIAAIVAEFLTVGVLVGPFNQRKRLAAVLYVSSLIAAYRIALLVIHAPEPCSCLGKIRDILPLTESQVSLLLAICLSYMVIGSAILLYTTRLRFPEHSSLEA